MKNKVKKYLFSLLFLAALDGCGKLVTVPPPVTQVTAAGAFSNDATAEATVAGLYSQIMSGGMFFLNGANTLYGGLSADELYGTTPDAATDAFTNNSLLADNPIVTTPLWERAYSYLYVENACLEGIGGAGGVSETTKEKLSGEALFMRGLMLFYLTNLFGDIPLPLTTDYKDNAGLPRSDSATVYARIIADLRDAEDRFRRSGMNDGPNRPGAAACEALLARVYLYQKNWVQAANETDTVIGSGAYGIESLDAVFSAGNREAIFSLVPVIPSLNTAEGLYFIPYDETSLPLYGITDALLAAFEEGDGRKSAWVGSQTVNGITYAYPYKYKARGSDAVTENYVVLRLAEQYLIRAEARAHIGDLDGATEDINTIRVRAGLLPLDRGLVADVLLSRIAGENRIEFFGEWGHRWLDLKRTGTADEVLSRLKPGWKATDVLYPIPYSQLLLNPALVQNKGY